MIEDAEMAEYRLKRTFRDQPCEVYFFGTWSGYIHPVRPQTPLRYREALTRPAFYKAYLCPAKFGPAFVYFRKQTYEREQVELRIPLLSNGVAERYFTFVRQDNSILVSKEVDAQEAVDLDQYLHARFVPNVHELAKVELVRINGWSSFEYFYDDGGTLTKYVVTNSGGTHNVFENGQAPRLSFPIDRQR